MKKKLGLITATVALGALLAVGGTLAWFTDTETATNVVTTGNVNVSILENGTTMDDAGIEFPANQVPGASLEKVVTVKNTGANPAYVRATINILDEKGEAIIGRDFTTIRETLQFPENSLWEQYDGKFYYLDEVVTGDAGVTGALISEIKIPTTWNNSMVNREFKIEIFVEAIQSENLLADGTAVNAENLATAFGADSVTDLENPAN